MKKVRTTIIDDICFFLIFLLDLAAGFVCVFFIAKGWSIGDYDDTYTITIYAFFFNLMNIGAVVVYYKLAFAFCELHLCLCALRLGLSLCLGLNALMAIYNRLERHIHTGGARFEFQLYWLFLFLFNALCNAFLVRSLHPHLRLRAARPPLPTRRSARAAT